MTLTSRLVGAFLLAFVSFVSVVHAQIPGGSGGTGKFPNPFGEGTNDSLYDFVYFVLTNIVMPIGSVIVVFFVIYAGFLFVTARGNEKKLDSAKKTFVAVVIGAVVLLGSWTIATAIKGTVCQISDGSIPDLCN